MLIGNDEFILMLKDTCPANCPSLRYEVQKVEVFKGEEWNQGKQ
jgi:hypothetical protein